MFNEKKGLQEILQIAIDKKVEGYEISKVGSDNKVAIFKSYAGHIEKIWEGNWELCLKYIDTL